MAISKEALERLSKIVSEIEDCETRQLVGGEVANVCEEENPTEFDKDSFLDACIGDDCQAEEPVEESEQVQPEETEEEEKYAEAEVDIS